MEGITLLLNKLMLKYNWVGFYMLEAGPIRRCWPWDTTRER
jgi:putative methionine-R-sulfoxide reductase with GAF domain